MNIEIKNHQNIANLSKELKDSDFILDSSFDPLVLETMLGNWSKAKKMNIKALSSRPYHSSREDKLQNKNVLNILKRSLEVSVIFLMGKSKKEGINCFCPDK